MYNGWDIQFPGDYRDHKQAFSSRLYCENIYPMLDNNDELVRGCDGKPIITTIGVRKREDPEFADFPFKLWDKNPKWALYWDWVLPEHKAMAQKILERRDLDESQLRKTSHFLFTSSSLPRPFTHWVSRKGKVSSSDSHVRSRSAYEERMVRHTSSSCCCRPDFSFTRTGYAAIRLENQQTSYWAPDYGRDSNDREV